jgi:hypothetical protein
MPFDALPAETNTTVIPDPGDMLRELLWRMQNNGEWCKGIYHNDDGQHCTIGWLDVVLAEKLDAMGPEYLEQLRQLSRVMIRRIHDALPRSAQRKDRAHAIMGYNDKRGHNAVLKVIAKAAAD